MIQLIRPLFSVFLFLLSLTALALDIPVIGPVALEQNVNLPPHLPENLNQVPEVLISRNEYLISFNPATRLLNWASWKMDMSDIGRTGRSNNFQPDGDLQTYLNQINQQAIKTEDYRGSCFDRGHQVPSADRNVSPEINRMTFLMSNMLPQTAYLNRGIWEHLERYSRELVTNENKKLYIMTGPVFDEDFGAIGPNKDIRVPSKNFKVIVVLNAGQTLQDITAETRIISVLMPNTLKNGHKPLDDKEALCAEAYVPPKTPKPVIPATAASDDTLPAAPVAESVPFVRAPAPTDWMQYQVPLEQIEKLSGFKFSQEIKKEDPPVVKPEEIPWPLIDSDASVILY